MALARKITVGLLSLLFVLSSISAGRQFERAHSDAHAPCSGAICVQVRHVLVQGHQTAAVRALIVAVLAFIALAGVLWWHQRTSRQLIA